MLSVGSKKYFFAKVETYFASKIYIIGYVKVDLPFLRLWKGIVQVDLPFLRLWKGIVKVDLPFPRLWRAIVKVDYSKKIYFAS